MHVWIILVRSSSSNDSTVRTVGTATRYLPCFKGVFNNIYPLFGTNSLAKFKHCFFFSLYFCFILVEFKHIMKYTVQNMCLKRLKLR